MKALHKPKKHPRDPTPKRVLFKIRLCPKPKKEEETEIMQEFTNEFYVGGTIAYVTKAGNPAQVHGAPLWSFTDPAVAEVRNVTEDGFSGEVWPLDGAAGVGELVITADADLGDGVTPIETRVAFSILQAGAASGTVTFGAPIPKPIPE